MANTEKVSLDVIAKSKRNSKVGSKSLVQRSAKGKVLVVLSVFLIVALLVGSWFLYQNWQNAEKELTNYADPEKYQELQEELTQSTISQVSKLILLPDEKPTVATIVDVVTLRDQNPEFYKDAVNGDKILIYSSKAIIFREESDIIINVLPVISVPQDSAEQSEEEQSVVLDIEVANGSYSADALAVLTESIGDVDSDYIVKEDGTTSHYYQTSTVYDLSDGVLKAEIESLAKALKHEYSTSLPNGIDSDADVYIIAASDLY